MRRPTPFPGSACWWTAERTAHKTAFHINRTDGVALAHNRFDMVETLMTLGTDVRGLAIDVPPDQVQLRGDNLDIVAPLPGGMDPMLPARVRRGRELIVVDGWGRYDWTSPTLWPAAHSDEEPALSVRVLALFRAGGLDGAPIALRERKP